MFMMTDKEFVAEMLEKIPSHFKSKRKFAHAIGEANDQNIQHWITRQKVPGDKKPIVAQTLDIDWPRALEVREGAKNYEPTNSPLAIEKVTYEIDQGRLVRALEMLEEDVKEWRLGEIPSLARVIMMAYDTANKEKR